MYVFFYFGVYPHIVIKMAGGIGYKKYLFEVTDNLEVEYLMTQIAIL